MVHLHQPAENLLQQVVGGLEQQASPWETGHSQGRACIAQPKLIVIVGLALLLHAVSPHSDAQLHHQKLLQVVKCHHVG
jgi:hypothetical protein